MDNNGTIDVNDTHVDTERNGAKSPINNTIKSANIIYPATTFLSACLMFTLQPMFAKILTPLMGGTPAVWNTALVFYQGTLLIGYFYAHFIATRLSLRNQLITHGLLLLVGLLFLPIRVSALIGAPNVESPVGWTLMALLLSIGAPIIAISATAPLVQAWRARIGDGVNPYRLYAASNLGSFLALAAYPFLIEPFIGVKLQGVIWSGTYIILAILLFLAIRSVPKGSVAPKDIAQSKTNISDIIKWVCYAAVPSALLVAVTTHIVTDVASVPLLWIPPLALFLLTFVIAFGDRAERLYEVAVPLKFVFVFVLAAIMAGDGDDGYIGLGIHLLVFFIIVLSCHLELSSKRPEPARLTEFYLWMSVGGVLGGAFAALAAPVIFNTTIEYQIILIGALLVAPWKTANTKWALLATIMAIAIATLFLKRFEVATFLDINLPINTKDGIPSTFWNSALLVWDSYKAGFILCLALGLVAALVARSAILTATLGALALFLPIYVQDDSLVRFRDRSFFGVLEITDSSEDITGLRQLSHGTTLHGIMSLDPSKSRIPMSYYYHKTPIGLLFDEASNAKPETLHAGVIGLGMGSTTCYAKPKQDWTVFEIDSQVVEATVNSPWVRFVKRCAPQTKIVMGDARLSLQTQKNGWFDILLVDAFTSDAIPTHMITQEAITMMMSKIAPDGILIVHISNRFLGLQNIVADAANAGGFSAIQGLRNGDDNDSADTGVRAMVIAHNQQRLERYTADYWQKMPKRKNAKPWTDDRTDIIQAIIDNDE